MYMLVFVALPIQVWTVLGELLQGLKQHIHRNSKARARPEREQFKFVAYFYNGQE